MKINKYTNQCERLQDYSVIPAHIIDAGYLGLKAKMFLIWVLTQPTEEITTKEELVSKALGAEGVALLRDLVMELSMGDHLDIRDKGESWNFYENCSDCLHDRRVNKVEY